MKETSRLNDGHYDIALPWRKEEPCLPDNKLLARHRLNVLKKKLAINQELFQKYSEFIGNLLSMGYAEKVPEEERGRSDGHVWYLPHHPVFHPTKGKLRVVFDCSAKYRDISLNSQLLTGPNLTNTLVRVLMRFRQDPVVIMSDIEAMFHQVRVVCNQRDFLRFLWWPGNDLLQEPVEYRMKVHLFGAVSSPSCCSFAIQKTAEDNKDSFDAETIQTVMRNFYVDDCLKSVENDLVAITLVQQLQQLMAKGGFRLTKWLSNSRRVLEAIPESERAATVKNLHLEDLPIERALGNHWNIEMDVFGYNVTIKTRPQTRRGILSIVTSIYDPMGIAAPFVLPAKSILQDLCRKGVGWDEPIPEEHRIRWERWLTELPRLAEFSVDRCFKPVEFGPVVSCQLHHFSDASESAYGAVSYVRMVNQDEKIHCAFLIGKSRVAPLKSMTIPRLELSAATVSVRLDKMARRELELPIDDSIFWTDSTSVLRYIENQDKRCNTFVANRIGTIRDNSSLSQWRHVDGKLNPADDASRGLSADHFLSCARWIKGPEFLWRQSEVWPKRPDGLGEVLSDDPEVKKEVITCISVKDEGVRTVDSIIEHFSSWARLKKFFAWMLRFRQNLLVADRKRSNGNSANDHQQSTIKPITVTELKIAERELLKDVQKTNFPEELTSCRGAIVPASKSTRGHA
jgi:hypothetical protein